ncbi:hypothetical protein [Streptomyces sp. NPDC054866]
MTDIEESIRLYILVAGLRPSDPTSAATTTASYVLSDLGAALGTRYDLSGDPADLWSTRVRMLAEPQTVAILKV